MGIYIDGFEGVDDCFNLGHTKHTYEERHKNSDYGKAGQVVSVFQSKRIKLAWWPDAKTLDHPIHEWLKKNVWLEPIGRETYRLIEGVSLDQAKQRIAEKFFSDVKEKKKTIELRDHQRAFVAKARKDYDKFLLFAKCRAGKSVMTLSHIVDKNIKMTLVVSRYTSPVQSWRDDIAKYTNFNNIVFINVEDKGYIQQIKEWKDTDKQIVIFGTVQAINKWSTLHECGVNDADLIVYDEADIGYESEQWLRLRKLYTCPVLYVTGTAYKMVWNFTDSNRYIYSYFEEQLDKKMGFLKDNPPTMNVVVAKHDTSAYKKVFGDDPDATKNVFRVDQGKFVEPALVQDFINKWFNQTTVRPENRLFRNSTHLYITLPSVAACHAFAKYMKGTRFAPLVVTGDTKIDADRIVNHIDTNPLGSCIITRAANVRGVTADKVDTIVNLAEGSSLEFWTQFAFRGGSGEHDWMVVDFIAQRCLATLREIFVSACELSPRVAECEFIDYIPTTEYVDSFDKINSDRLNEILAADVGNAIRLVSGIKLNSNNLKNLVFDLELESKLSVKVKEEVVNDNDANGKSNKKRLTIEEREAVKKETLQAKTIKAILERVPLVLYHAIKSGQLMNNIDSVLTCPHYQHVTMDEENIIEMALDHDVINRQTMSRCVSSAYVDIQHAIKQDERGALHELSVSAQDQKGIPLEYLDSMFAEL